MIEEELYLNALYDEAYDENDKSLWRVYMHRAMAIGFSLGVQSVPVMYCDCREPTKHDIEDKQAYCGKCWGKITAVNY